MSLQAASRNWNSGVTPSYFGGCNGVSERRPFRMRGATAPDYVLQRWRVPPTALWVEVKRGMEYRGISKVRI